MRLLFGYRQTGMESTHRMTLTYRTGEVDQNIEIKSLGEALFLAFRARARFVKRGDLIGFELQGKHKMDLKFGWENTDADLIFETGSRIANGETDVWWEKHKEVVDYHERLFVEAEEDGGEES